MIAKMPSTPAQRFVCPRCRTSYDELFNYCPECGADMMRGAPDDSRSGPPRSRTQSRTPELDRRLTDSNRAWLGKIVDGRYRVLEVIGRGGMGVVYRVEHVRMGKMAAMKVLHRDLANDPDVVARFEREATSVSKLDHPHTVQVFDFGTAGGALYLIMELIRGQDLGRIIDRDGPMPWARAAPLLAQICGALQEAHERGIIHRDLKPENVLITRTTGGRDFAKVLDFGLVKLELDGAPKRETERQAIVGTPYFMSPEQIRGDEVDARTDIYSLGALMFELLTGEHLYTGSTAVGVLTKHLTAEPDAPSMRAPDMGIPPAVDHLCHTALARDPEDRWASAAEFGAAIEEVYAETVSETTGSRSPRARSRGPLVFESSGSDSDLRLRRSDIDAFEASLKRRRWLVVLVMIALCGGVIATAVWFVTRPPPARTTEREPNDDIATADRIGAGAPVTGYLGKRRSTTEGDRDVYRIDWPSGEKRVIDVTVSGIPNLDLDLSLTDRNGHVIKIDEGGVGAGEGLHRRAIDGPIAIAIGEAVPRGQLPVENISDPYTLTVTEDAIAGGEIEPNGTDADANPIGVREPLTGYLDHGNDVDMLRFSGSDGSYHVTVRSKNPVIWQTADHQRRTEGVALVTLHKGELIRIERAPKTTAVPSVPWAIEIAP